jgi:hypothetical protein
MVLHDAESCGGSAAAHSWRAIAMVPKFPASFNVRLTTRRRAATRSDRPVDAARTQATESAERVGIVADSCPDWGSRCSPFRQTPSSLGGTEGTRTPDLQGHNLGHAGGGDRRRPWDTTSELRTGGRAARVYPGVAAAAEEGVGARLLPGRGYATCASRILPWQHPPGGVRRRSPETSGAQVGRRDSTVGFPTARLLAPHGELQAGRDILASAT